MPSVTDTLYAIKQAVDTLNLNIAVSWPNMAFEITYPFMNVDILYVDSKDDTLEGTQVIDEGRIMFLVVVEKDTGQDEITLILDTLRAAFKKGTRIVRNATTIEVKSPPRPVNPYQTEVRYYFPLEVSFEAH